MSMREISTLALWLLGSVTALLLSAALWLLPAEEGKVTAFALVPLMWSVALGAGFAHHVSQSGLLARLRSLAERLPAPSAGAHAPT
jgi:hypothetical protein